VRPLELVNAWARRRERELRALIHYRPRQVAWRAVIAARRRVASLAPGRWTRLLARAQEVELAPIVLAESDPWIDFALAATVTPPEREDDILAGRFSFLNKSIRFRDRPDWFPRGAEAPSHLWRMNLHYHRFLVDAAVGALRRPDRREALLTRADRTLDDWTARCPVADSNGWADAWNSYAVATRLLNARLARRVVARLEGAQAARFAARLDALGASSAIFLEHWIERDLGGNHLVRNACALVAAGRWFRGPRAARWLTIGNGILRADVQRQFLADGFHEERSPMYHALVLEDLLATLPATGDRQVDETRELIGRAIAALSVVEHPDGQLALFNDSAFGIAPPLDRLRELAARLDAPSHHPAPQDLAIAGYFKLVEGRQQVVFDAGPLGPDHLPAHAHCDALSFEWSVGTTRVVTDTGVDRYEAGPERDFQRSVRAHSTLEIDGRDQAEPFGSFRMGRRPHVVGLRSASHAVSGSHDGYGAAGRHERRLSLESGDGPAWIDRLDGPGEHPVTVRLGLAPGVSASIDRGLAAVDAGPGGRWRWSTPTEGQVAIEGGSYCPQFGRSVPRLVLTWRGSAGRSRDLPFALVPLD
jgi:uncharacterized heparinase superfamily protein